MTLPFELKKSAGKFEQDFIRAQFGLEVSHGDLPHESPHSKTHSKLHHYVEEAKHLSHHSHHVIHHSHHIKPRNPHLEKGAKPAADVYKKSNENDEEDKAEIKPAGKKKEVIKWDSANENYNPSYEAFPENLHKELAEWLKGENKYIQMDVCGLEPKEQQIMLKLSPDLRRKIAQTGLGGMERILTLPLVDIQKLDRYTDTQMRELTMFKSSAIREKILTLPFEEQIKVLRLLRNHTNTPEPEVEKIVDDYIKNYKTHSNPTSSSVPPNQHETASSTHTATHSTSSKDMGSGNGAMWTVGGIGALGAVGIGTYAYSRKRQKQHSTEDFDPSYEVFGMESADSEVVDETFKLLHGDTHTHVYDSNGDYVGKFRKIGNYSPNTVTTAKGQLARIKGKLAFKTTSRQKVLADNTGGLLNHVGTAVAGGVAAIGGKMYYDHQKKGEGQ